MESDPKLQEGPIGLEKVLLSSFEVGQTLLVDTSVRLVATDPNSSELTMDILIEGLIRRGYLEDVGEAISSDTTRKFRKLKRKK